MMKEKSSITKVKTTDGLFPRATIWLALFGCGLMLIMCMMTLHKVFPGSDVGGVWRRNQAHPVILIPGDGGTQVEAKLNKTSGPHYFCTKKTNYW